MNIRSMLKDKGLFLFLSIVFINCVVDVAHKIIIQNTVMMHYDGNTQIYLTALVNGLILIPFILAMSPAGFFADKYQKAKVIRYSALSAIFLCMGIMAAYFMGLFWVAFCMTFLLAIQSALYSPAKYGYIKDIVGTEKLSSGNAMVQAVTIVGILGGMAYFSYQFESLYAAAGFVENAASTPGEILKPMLPLAAVMIVLSIFEYIFALKLPEVSQTDDSLKFKAKDYLTGGYAKDTLKPVLKQSTILISIIGVAIFWGISQSVLAIYPTFFEETFKETSVTKIQIIMAMSGIGIIFGSYLASRFSKNYIETGIIPVGAIGVAASLYVVASYPDQFIHLIAFMVMGICGALFIIPLNSLMQFHAHKDQMGKVIAGNNFIQNVIMVTSLILVSAAVTAGLSTGLSMYLIATVAVVGAFYTLYKIPQSLVRFIISFVMTQRYKLTVKGIDNIPNDKGVLILANHISWLDWGMIQMASPRHVRFVMERTIYNRWYLKWFLDLMGVIPISAGMSKSALESISQSLKDGDVVCLFPEGAISRNSQLGEFKSGFVRAVAKLDTNEATIVPCYLGGMWGSKFSRATDKLKDNRKSSSLLREVLVTFGQQLDIHSSPTQVKQAVSHASKITWDSYIGNMRSLDVEIFDMCMKRLTDTVTEDTTGKQFSGAMFLSLGQQFKVLVKKNSNEQNIGLLLPTSSICSIMNYAVISAGKTVINMNYTAQPESVASSMQLADVKTVFTSRLFVKKLDKKGINVNVMLEGLNVIYLEDIKDEVRKVDVIIGIVILYTYKLATWLSLGAFDVAPKGSDPDATATILFSSGSEGTPKGVELTHKNLISNAKQVSNVLNPYNEEKVLSSLPAFHCFGLVVTNFMPLLEGIPMVCHPDPTDAVNIGKAVAKHKITVMCGTSTFLRLYARNRKVHPLMMESLRVVVAGAEKVSEDVRTQFAQRFGKTIYEGYGATECSPVISVNLPDHIDTNYWHVQKGSEVGTVGLPLPGTITRIVDMETYEELPEGDEGLIVVSGPQVMKGYLKNPEKTEEVLIDIDGETFYYTGDKGFMKAGFITITDRISRFFKLGGELISGSQVEQGIAKLINEDTSIAVVSKPDEKKGEAIVLVFTSNNLSEDDMKTTIKESNMIPLMKPTSIIKMDAIPTLGSGKVDYKAIEKIVRT